MSDFNGLGMNLGNLPNLSNAQSRSISAENLTGDKGKAGMAKDGTGAHAARDLGAGWKVSPFVIVKPGEEFALADIDGPGALQSMWFGGNIGREYIFRIYWENQAQPSVEVPICDFFACGWHNNHNERFFKGPFFPVNSIPVAVNPNNAMNCFWVMPFKKHCRVTVENRHERDYTCYYHINYTLTDVPDDMAYFHAQFRCTKPVPYKGVHTFLDGVKGKGHYVGTALSVGLNGAGNWWGEGEVKFYIDGDREFPTICGTGTEDYFGGSYDWEVDGKYVTYSAPYMGMHRVTQSDGLYNHQQRFSMYRWHVMDPVRFESDLRVTIQDLGWRVLGDKYLARQDDFYSVAYWYQTLPASPFPPLPGRDEIEVV